MWTTILEAIQAFTNREEGQTLVEYGLIVTLVAIAAAVGLTALGGDLSTFFTGLGGDLNSVLP